jgi:hypothetical protein
MTRLYLPLLPVALAAAIAAASACKEPRGVEPQTRFIPPAAPLATPASLPAPETSHATKAEPLAVAEPAETPSAADLQEFGRAVPK